MSIGVSTRVPAIVPRNTPTRPTTLTRTMLAARFTSTAMAVARSTTPACPVLCSRFEPAWSGRDHRDEQHRDLRQTDRLAEVRAHPDPHEGPGEHHDHGDERDGEQHRVSSEARRAAHGALCRHPGLAATVRSTASGTWWTSEGPCSPAGSGWRSPPAPRPRARRRRPRSSGPSCGGGHPCPGARSPCPRSERTPGPRRSVEASRSGIGARPTSSPAISVTPSDATALTMATPRRPPLAVATTATETATAVFLAASMPRASATSCSPSSTDVRARQRCSANDLDPERRHTTRSVAVSKSSKSRIVSQDHGPPTPMADAEDDPGDPEGRHRPAHRAPERVPIPRGRRRHVARGRDRQAVGGDGHPAVRCAERQEEHPDAEALGPEPVQDEGQRAQGSGRSTTRSSRRRPRCSGRAAS